MSPLPELERHEDAEGGFSLLVPRDWEYVVQPAPEVRFVCVEPLAGQGFRSNVVVTVDELPEGLSLHDWQDGADRLLPSMMDGWQLIDRYPTEGGDGVPAIARLGHHVVEQSAPVTLRQVAVLSGTRGVTLSTSVWTPAYSALYEAVLAIEASLSVVPLESGGGA